jgi:hypothetical protein
MSRTRTCAFCGIELEPQHGAGRPTLSCSKSCRQALYDERAGRILKTLPWHLWRRRRDARECAELERLIQVGELSRFEATAEAQRRASAAWPRPVDPDSASIYVVGHVAGERAA